MLKRLFLFVITDSIKYKNRVPVIKLQSPLSTYFTPLSGYFSIMGVKVCFPRQSTLYLYTRNQYLSRLYVPHNNDFFAYLLGMDIHVDGCRNEKQRDR